MADGGRAVGELDVAEGPLARAHAVQEVAEDAPGALVVRDVDVGRLRDCPSDPLLGDLAFGAAEVQMPSQPPPW